MTASSFIADMNNLQKEFDTLPLEVTRLISSLLELVEAQQSSIDALLIANGLLLDANDRLRG